MGACNTDHAQGLQRLCKWNLRAGFAAFATAITRHVLGVARCQGIFTGHDQIGVFISRTVELSGSCPMATLSTHW